MADQYFRANHPDWKELTELTIERGDDELYRKSLNGDGAPYFDIDFEAWEFIEWESNLGLPDDMLDEAINESWAERTKWSPYQRTVVVAFTDPGWKITIAVTDIPAAVIIVRLYAYWADDNVLMHEFSHLFFAHDHLNNTDPHYHDDCIMSYEPVWLGFVFEDGGVWWVGHEESRALVTKNYCSLCHYTVYLNAIRFNPPSMHNRRYPT